MKLSIRLIRAALTFILAMMFFIPFCFAQTGEWIKLNPVNSPLGRAGHAMAPAGEGKVLMFGGMISWKYLNDIWLYDYDKNTWTELKPDIKPPKRRVHSFCRLTNNHFLLFGGDSLGPYLGDTWIFSLSDTTWTELTFEETPCARRYHDMVNISENKAILFGGMDWENGHYLKDTWIFDYSIKEWKKIKFDFLFDPVPKYREGVCMTCINDGNIFLYGGWVHGLLNDTWIFELETESWIELEPENISPNKSGHSMSSLNENYILVFGGQTDGRWYIDDTWLFNLIDTTWVELNTESKPEGRSAGVLTKISDGKAILFGGVDYYVFNDTWLFTLNPSGFVENNNLTDDLKIQIINQNDIIIKYFLPECEFVKIEVINLLGHIVQTNSFLKLSGWHELIIHSNRYSTGTYILSISTKNKIITDKFHIIN